MSDVCTLWFDSLGPWNWHACCVQHDFDYGHQVVKAIADAKLEHCVNAILPGMGTLMWLGVTIFGGIWYAMAKRKATPSSSQQVTEVTMTTNTLVFPAIQALDLKGTDSAYMTAFEAGEAAGLFVKYEITSPLRVASFLAQVLEESGGLTALREDMNYSAARIMQIFGVNKHSAAVTDKEAASLAHNPKALAERVYGLGNPHMAQILGNTVAGDGYNYRGGGPLQTTGKGAYITWGAKLGVDFVSNSDLICDPRYILMPALFEWNEKGCNALADKNDQKGVTKAINGGYNGYADRITWFNKIWDILNKANKTPVAPYQVAAVDPSITWVQQSLNQLGADPQLVVDGKWGAQSESALRAYQIANNLVVDGIPGDATKASLSTRLNTASARSPAVMPLPLMNTKRIGAAVASASLAGQPILDKVSQVKTLGLPIDNQLIQNLLIGCTGLGVVLLVVGIVMANSKQSSPVTK